MASKAEASALLTMASSVGGLMQWLNGWVSTYMPLFTVAGIIGGLILSWWFYRASLRQKERHHREETEIGTDDEDPGG